MFCAAILATTYIYRETSIDNIVVTPMRVVVTDGKVGFNVDAHSANFGAVPRGEMSERTIALYGSDNYNTKVIIYTYGKMGDWIILENNSFILPKEQKMNLSIQVCPPINTTLGEYTGKLKAVFYKRWKN